MTSIGEKRTGSPMHVNVNFSEEIGSLIINFQAPRGGRREVLKSDALVLITLANGKVADIQILLDDKEVIKKLSRALVKTMDNAKTSSSEHGGR